MHFGILVIQRQPLLQVTMQFLETNVCGSLPLNGAPYLGTLFCSISISIIMIINTNSIQEE
jgi:hypothetical protein